MTDPVYVARRPLSRNPWFGRGDGVALWGRIAGDDDLNHHGCGWPRGVG